MPETLSKLKRAFFPDNGTRLGAAAYAFLFLLCTAFFLPGIASMPPTDRDESLFAQASKQMIETGNYTDIRVQDKPRYKKPIGIYWLQSAAVRALSPGHLNEIWAYRVPSFVGATVAVLMTAALGALLFSPMAGFLAGVMMAGCVLLNVEARLAKTDAALLACIVTSMWGLARAYLRKIEGLGVPFVFWTALAIGVLIKGPVILLPLFGTLLWLFHIEKSLMWLGKLRPVNGIVYAAALIAPWFIAISMQSHGAFMEQSAGNDMLAKIWQGQNRGMLPPGLHLLAFPILFFPFSLFSAFAAPDVWENRGKPAVRFCLGWIIPTWLVFEMTLTKLPHYVLPTYPAIAILTAKYLLDGFPVVTRSEDRWPVMVSAGIWFAIGAGFAFLFSALPSFTNKDIFLPQVAAAGVLLLSQGPSLGAYFGNKITSAVLMTFASLTFLTITFAYTLPRLDHVWMSREIVQTVGDNARCDSPQVVTLGYHEPSLIFMAGTNTIVAKSSAEAAEAFRNGKCRFAVIDARHKDEFLGLFKDNADKQLRELNVIEALNIGRGKKIELTVFNLEEQ
ncbi:MAG: glycosyltransferase family 39 protein [Alphaproteobacteria bacterium]|nr:glycosyltransferase family 39 protein [Alphaproteobacteria bacterium]